VARLIFTQSYNKRAKEFLNRYPELIKHYTKILELLEANPVHHALRTHKLKAKLSALYTVSITLSYRITIEFLIENDTIIPVNIGSHDEVY